MFYHLEILKKTGPFYPLWLADTYPRRFLRIPENKIWSYNVAEICDNLIEIIKAETMNPGKRFSLRLSARLTYGALKLFERQRQMLLHGVFSLNMAITKRRAVEVEKPKKKHKKSTSEVQAALVQRPEPSVPQVEEQLIAEGELIRMLNLSQRVQNTEITLRENALIPAENKMDNFGEEGDPVAMFLQDNILRDGRVDETILQQSTGPHNIVVVAEVHRANEPTPPPDHNVATMTDVSCLEKTLNPADEIVIEASKTIEISKLNETTVMNLEHEIVPEIQVTSIAPDLQTVPHVIEDQNVQEKRGEKRPHSSINLDETPVLDPNVTLPVPRRRRRVIKDANIFLHHDYMKARIENPYVELRCQHPLRDAMNIEAAISDYRFLLPHAAFERRSLINKMGRLSRMLRAAYTRNLLTRVVPNEKSAFKRLRQIEEIRGDVINETSRNITLYIPTSHIEDQRLTLPPNANTNNMSILVPSPTHHSMLTAQDKSMMPEVTIPDIEISKDTTIEKSTSKSQRQRDKPVSILTTTMDDIRQDISKSVSFNISEKRKKSTSKKIEANKENIQQQIPPPIENVETIEVNQNIPADVQQLQMEILKEVPMEVETLREENSLDKSKYNETMLGSLDKTNVSLGDDSMTAEEKTIKEYLEKEWGNMGMWEKIVKAKQARCYPLNIEVIIKRAEIPTYISKRRVAVNAFKAILLMRKYRFIKVEKYPEELTILNIRRGDAVKDLCKK